MTNLTNIAAEFAANVKTKTAQLAGLFEAYDAAVLGYDTQQARAKQCHHEALNASEYYAAEDFDRAGIKAGDRITSESFDFLLPEEDWERYVAASLLVLVREGLTDAEGTYTTDWCGIERDARRALVDFIIDEILPEGMRAQFEAVRLNYVQTEKLIGIVRLIVKA